MKTTSRIVFIALLVALAACAPRERTIVILSTNDMHGRIQHFPRLATAVRECRDTAGLVMLVDAGDRWTGNAYVDMAPTPGMPMIALMNELGYDVATLGNHEFDHGQAFLGCMIDSMKFQIVCANCISDTATFPKLPPYIVVKKDGIRIGFVGAVTNYEGPGHPAGKSESFVGLEFPDPQYASTEYAAELRPRCDVMVLLSHMGDDRDRQLLEKGDSGYDLVVGGHTHEQIDTLINGTLLTQTGKNLTHVGATVIKMRGKHIVGLEYRSVPLEGYAEDPVYKAQVEKYYDNPELNEPVGEMKSTADKAGLANWVAKSIAEAVNADIGFYHIGGIRLDSLAKGGVGTARVYDLEPFYTRLAVGRMTTDDMRSLILAKYNEDSREGGRIDLIATTPYKIFTDEDGKAWDVNFPLLRDGKVYNVAFNSYIWGAYKGLRYTEGELLESFVTDVLLDQLRRNSPIVPDNTLHQRAMVYVPMPVIPADFGADRTDDRSKERKASGFTGR